MNVYMLKNETTGQWYGRGGRWVEKQEDSPVWISRHGPSNGATAAKMQQRRQAHRRKELMTEPDVTRIITYELVEKP